MSCDLATPRFSAVFGQPHAWNDCIAGPAVRWVRIDQTMQTYWLMTGAAVIIALGAVFGTADIPDRPPTEAKHAESV